MAVSDYDDDDDESPFDRNGLLKNGRTARVSMMMRDGMSDVQRAIAQDAVARRFDDSAARHRPGPVYCDRNAARAAYETAKREAQDAWKMLPAPAESADSCETGWEKWAEEDARPPIPVTDADFARLRQIRLTAYERAKRESEQAWKTPSALAADAAPPVRRDAAPVGPTYDVAEGRRRKQAAYDAMCAEMRDAWRNPLP